MPKTVILVFSDRLLVKFLQKSQKKVIEQFKTGAIKDIRNTVGAFTVSDSGGAMILTAESGLPKVEKILCESQCDQYNLCKYRVKHGLPDGRMDMGKILRYTWNQLPGQAKRSYPTLTGLCR